MKKILCISIFVFAVFSIWSCGGNTPDKSSNPAGKPVISKTEEGVRYYTYSLVENDDFYDILPVAFTVYINESAVKDIEDLITQYGIPAIEKLGSGKDASAEVEKYNAAYYELGVKLQTMADDFSVLYGTSLYEPYELFAIQGDGGRDLATLFGAIAYPLDFLYSRFNEESTKEYNEAIWKIYRTRVDNGLDSKDNEYKVIWAFWSTLLPDLQGKDLWKLLNVTGYDLTFSQGE